MLLGATLLEQAADHLAVGPLATVSDGERHEVARALIAFAEMAARATGLREVRLADGSTCLPTSPRRSATATA